MTTPTEAAKALLAKWNASSEEFDTDEELEAAQLADLTELVTTARQEGYAQAIGDAAGVFEARAAYEREMTKVLPSISASLGHLREARLQDENAEAIRALSPAPQTAPSEGTLADFENDVASQKSGVPQVAPRQSEPALGGFEPRRNCETCKWWRDVSIYGFSTCLNKDGPYYGNSMHATERCNFHSRIPLRGDSDTRSTPRHAAQKDKP